MPSGLIRVIAALSWASTLALVAAAACQVTAAAFPESRAGLGAQVMRHDLLLLGATPLAAAALLLLVTQPKVLIRGTLLRQLTALAGVGYALGVGAVALLHALLFGSSQGFVPELPDELMAAAAVGLLCATFYNNSVRRAGTPVLLANQEDEHGLDTPASRFAIDASCGVVMLWLYSATFWLLAGSLLALLASIKLHSPYFVADTPWLTFGRVRPAHLNTMILGWGSMAGIGVSLWLQARLARAVLPFRKFLRVGAYYWNAAVAVGTYEILQGNSSGVEWLEFPAYVAVPLALVFVLLFAVSVQLLLARQSRHIYVSQWYLFGAVFWFPFLYIVATVVIFFAPISGDVKAIANWWFAHNVLGLWLSPIGLASAYYFIPKVLGRPVHSYYLSILGFWSLALFYNWAGTHHLIGGPVSAWLVTMGVVGSIMMFVPVITVAINHHLTMVGHFSRLKTSPTLRFIVFAAMSYTLVSLQGSLMAIRAVNVRTHFTHYTIAHAHLGVYAFFTMMMFGSIYYIAPRLTGYEWFSARAIKVHFWGTAIGISLYFIGLSVGGVGQGTRMLNPDVPFLQVVAYTVPYLQLRSIAGVLITTGHIAFALSMLQMLRKRGAERRHGPTLLGRARNDLRAGGTP